MRTTSAVVVVAFTLLTPSFSSAQAWLPYKGEGSVSIIYQSVHSDGHFLEDGSSWAAYQSLAHDMIFEVDYGLTDRLALDVSLPYIVSKYTGREEPINLPQNVLDDGAYHGTFQDFQFGLHYNALRGPLTVSPFFTFIVPSHKYDTTGEAAAGARLRQFASGVYAGRLLNPVLSRTYVQGMYAYTAAEKVLGISLNRSNTELTIGQFITPALSVNFVWRGQWMHGGLDFSELYQAPPEVFLQGDRITRQNYHHVGGGAGLAINGSLSANFSFVKFVSGRNAHMGEAIFAGVSWSFGAH